MWWAPTPRATRSPRRTAGTGRTSSKGTDSRSLEAEDQIFNVTLAEAEAIFAQPKRGRDQKTKPPIAEFGESPDTGKPVRVLEGRFGPYVTDGATNATVPRGLDPETISFEEAIDLLARARREGPGEEEEGHEGREEAREEDGQEGREEGRRRPVDHAGRQEGYERGRQEGQGQAVVECGGARSPRYR